LVSDRLVRYVTRVAASYDRLQRHTAASRPPHAPTYCPEASAGSDSDSYCAIAALAAKGGMAGDEKSVDEHTDAGYRTLVDAPSAGGNTMVGSGIRYSDSDPRRQVASEAKSPPTRSQGSRLTEAAPGYGYAEQDR
jgi:hypothetical protein